MLGFVLGCERAPDTLVEADAERLASERSTWLGASDDNIVALRDAPKSGLATSGQARAAGGELCERYAGVATRIVNGWYPTGFDRVGYGGIIGTLGSTSVPDRTIGWRCSSEGLHLELDLPARDARHQSADDALADILLALPCRGVDVEDDGVWNVVRLVGTWAVAETEGSRTTLGE